MALPSELYSVFYRSASECQVAEKKVRGGHEEVGPAALVRSGWPGLRLVRLSDSESPLHPPARTLTPSTDWVAEGASFATSTFDSCGSDSASAKPL